MGVFWAIEAGLKNLNVLIRMTSKPLKNAFALFCLNLLWTGGLSVAMANMEPIPPFMGDWEGGWVE